MTNQSLVSLNKRWVATKAQCPKKCLFSHVAKSITSTDAMTKMFLMQTYTQCLAKT